MRSLYINSLLFISLFFCNCYSFATDVTEQSTCDELKISDARLNEIYKQLLLKYKHDQGLIRKLKNSQRMWMGCRDAEIELIYPHGQSAEYGSIYPACKCHILNDLTTDRIKFLEQWLNGIEMGDVCTGSRPIKN